MIQHKQMDPAEAPDPDILEALWCRLEKISSFNCPSACLNPLEDYDLDILPRFHSSLNALDVEDLKEAAEDAFLAAVELSSSAEWQYFPTNDGSVSTFHSP